MLIIANIIFIIDIKILKIMLLCSLFILIPKNIVLQIFYVVLCSTPGSKTWPEILMDVKKDFKDNK